MTTETVSVTPNPIDAVKHAAASDIGLRREENQDSFGIIEASTFKLYIVADGMGGVKGGGIASNLAINVLKECLEDKSDINEAAIVAAVEHANTEIFEKGTGDPALAGMGTTFVGLGFVASKMIISSVGDSRAYRVRDNNIVQLTMDHTLVMELLRSGAISAEQADNHPVSHMLTRSLGPAPTVEVDCWVCADGPARGDIYIMCSDGLYNLVHAHEIAAIVQDNYIDVAVQKLIKLANERGGTDNITVIVVEIGEDFPVGPEAFESAEPKPQAAAAAEPEQDENRVAAGAPDPISLSNGTHEAKLEENSPDSDQVSSESAAEPRGEPRESPRLQPKIDFAAAKSAQERSTHQGESLEPSEELAAASEETQPRVSRSVLLFGAFLLTLISFIGGFFAPRLMSGGLGDGAREVVLAPVQPQAQIARLDAAVALESAQPKPLAPTLRIGLSDIAPSQPVESHSGVGHDGAVHDGEIGGADLARVVRRKEALRQLLGILEEKVGAFERPLNSKFLEQLQATRQTRENLERQENDLRAQIDMATRKLAVWYGRRKRLQSTDPINLATEVAVASPTVKNRKEVFELATWSYLKEAEVLRYNPADEKQERRVFELARVRKERQRELAEEVRRAIDREVSESDRAIAELTLQRDKLLSEIENHRRNEEYVRVLMGNDPRAKELKRKELERERDIAAAELEELNILVPDTQASPIQPEYEQDASAALPE